MGRPPSFTLLPPYLRRAFRLTSGRSGSTVEPRNRGRPGKLGLEFDRGNLMTRHNARTSRSLSRRWWTPYLMVVAGVCLAMPSPGLNAQAKDPDVPADLEVPAGHKLFLQARAIGTQNYICLPTDSGVDWAFFGPQATLFKFRRQIITHFLSPNPDEEDLPRATWQHSRIPAGYGAMRSHLPPIPVSLSQVRFPGCCSRWWERSRAPAGGTRLMETVYIQRIRTSGGEAPETGCDDQDPNVGARALVPYEADYLFYKPIFPR